MKTILAILVTILCWGLYGPVLHWGQIAMDHTRLRPFICVGIAYFVIAVVVPGIVLYLRGETGHWTVSGTIWSLAAGAAGAVGALGIILAFAFHGRPVFVMPLVFGGAPVVNAFWTIVMSRAIKKVGPVFIAGLILVVAGAVTVLVFKPQTGSSGIAEISFANLVLVLLSVLGVAICWGTYGPVLHKGQMTMAGSRLRPLICVGMSYFVVAVVVPVLLLAQMETEASFTTTGTLWSLAAGAAGAVGALGIIVAFNAGGKPIYVMPLVFGVAPVVNTFFSMASGSSAAPGPVFYAGLILVALGAVIVLVCAPRGQPHPNVKSGSSPKTVIGPTKEISVSTKP